MSRPPYPHRCLGGDPFVWACRCKATPDPNSDKAARDGWGSGCRVAMEERIAEAEAERDATKLRLAAIIPAHEIAAAYGARDDETPDDWATRVVAERDAACELLDRRLAGWAEATAPGDRDQPELGRRPTLAQGVAFIIDELDATMDEARRLRDLVRHQRGPLHDADLLTDEEYAALAADAGAVARLRGYDELRRELDGLRTLGASIHKAVAAALEARAKELDAKADAALAAADKAEEAGDEEREDAESARWTAYRVAARIVRGV